MVTSAGPRQALESSIGKDQIQGLWIGLMVLIHNSMQLPVYQMPVQAVVTCATRGPCHLGNLPERERQRQTQRDRLTFVHARFLQALVTGISSDC